MKQLVLTLLTVLTLAGCAQLSSSNDPGQILFAVTGLRSADANTPTQPTIMEIDFVAGDNSNSFTQTIGFEEGRWVAYSPELAADQYVAKRYRLFNGATLVESHDDIHYALNVEGGKAVLFPESILLFRDIDAKGGFKPFGFGLNRWQQMIGADLAERADALVLPETSE